MSDISEAERALKHAANRTANVLYAHMVSQQMGPPPPPPPRPPPRGGAAAAVVVVLRVVQCSASRRDAGWLVLDIVVLWQMESPHVLCRLLGWQ